MQPAAPHSPDPGLIDPQLFELLEAWVIHAVSWLRLLVEALGAVIVAMGVVAALYQVLAMRLHHRSGLYNRIRLTLARYLALALEFQLGADILYTAVAPSWDQIGKLGAIAAIRTVLNYFLMKETREAGEVEAAAEKHMGSPAPASPGAEPPDQV